MTIDLYKPDTDNNKKLAQPNNLNVFRENDWLVMVEAVKEMDRVVGIEYSRNDESIYTQFGFDEILTMLVNGKQYNFAITPMLLEAFRSFLKIYAAELHIDADIVEKTDF